MDNKGVINEEETVRLGIPWVVYHLLLLLLCKLGQVIDKFTLIFALWHAERELEFKVRQELIFEVESLNQK